VVGKFPIRSCYGTNLHFDLHLLVQQAEERPGRRTRGRPRIRSRRCSPCTTASATSSRSVRAPPQERPLFLAKQKTKWALLCYFIMRGLLSDLIQRPRLTALALFVTDGSKFDPSLIAGPSNISSNLKLSAYAVSSMLTFISPARWSKFSVFLSLAA
jgi:hypothetical protein